MNHSSTQARIFAKAYAKDTAAEMLAGIKANARDAETVTKIALGVTMPHQIGFIIGLAPLSWDSLTNVLESLTLIVGAVGIPIAVDFLILICVRTLVARGAARSSKITAFVTMLFPVAISGSVNYLAPAPMLLRVLFALAVVLIPMSQGVRAMNRPDFRKVQEMEIEVAQQVAPPSRNRKCKTGCTCGRHQKTPVEQIQDLVGVAPTSPAPMGR